MAIPAQLAIRIKDTANIAVGPDGIGMRIFSALTAAEIKALVIKDLVTKDLIKDLAIKVLEIKDGEKL